MPATEAAKQILDGVRRNYAEFSVPGYLLYLGHILRYEKTKLMLYFPSVWSKLLIIVYSFLFVSRILPKKASFMLRDLLDTGVDFG